MNGDRAEPGAVALEGSDPSSVVQHCCRFPREETKGGCDGACHFKSVREFLVGTRHICLILRQRHTGGSLQQVNEVMEALPDSREDPLGNQCPTTACGKGKVLGRSRKLSL